MRPLPSLVTNAAVPVSAIRKLAPVMPISAVRKCWRSTWRASRVMSGISAEVRVSMGRPCSLANSASTSSMVLCTAGAMMWDGVSPASCTMYSPRSVSTGRMPAAASASLRCASSESIDFDLAALLTPWRRAMSTTSRPTSSPSRAHSTSAPLAVARSSKISSQTSRSASVRLRIPSHVVRRVSKSSASSAKAAMPLARLPTNSGLAFCRARCNTGLRTFSPARAWKCMACECLAAALTSPPRPELRQYAGRVSSRRRADAGDLRCSSGSPDRRRPRHPPPRQQSTRISGPRFSSTRRRT